MTLAKYQPFMNDIYEYIRNRLEIDVVPDAIVNEVMSKYKIEIHFPVDQIILRDLIYRICEGMYYVVKKDFYRE